jgi:hypothetical protein
VAPSDHADSILASGQPPCVAAAPREGPCTWSVPLVDASDRVVGLVVASGGLDRGLRWVPLDSIGPRWSVALERLQHESDSVVATRHETSVAHGRVRPVLIGHRLALFQPRYAWLGDAAPTLISGAAVSGESAWGGATFIDAVGGSGPAAGGGTARDSGAAASPSVFRARVASLYDAMQSALRRGDLTAFGSAYAELGRLLGRAPSASRVQAPGGPTGPPAGMPRP